MFRKSSARSHIKQKFLTVAKCFAGGQTSFGFIICLYTDIFIDVNSRHFIVIIMKKSMKGQDWLHWFCENAKQCFAQNNTLHCFMFCFFPDSMSYVWGVAFSKDIGAEKSPRSNSARFVSAVYAFLALIMVNTYCANLMAFLVQESPILPISGIRDEKVHTYSVYRKPLRLLKEDREVIPILKSLLTENLPTLEKADRTTGINALYSFRLVV